MIFNFPTPDPLLSSKLYDQDTFYPAFICDLHSCKESVLIESPFITAKRMRTFYPLFREQTSRGVSVVVNTKDPVEYDDAMRVEAEDSVSRMQELGVIVLYTDCMHRKLAVIDRRTLWEGSLNILSQFESCEIMRRIESGRVAQATLAFINVVGIS